jgi:hypothetical protein
MYSLQLPNVPAPDIPLEWSTNVRYFDIQQNVHLTDNSQVPNIILSGVCNMGNNARTATTSFSELRERVIPSPDNNVKDKLFKTEEAHLRGGVDMLKDVLRVSAHPLTYYESVQGRCLL